MNNGGAALIPSFRTGVVDKNVAHHGGGSGEEVRPVLPTDLASIAITL
jgi:hypothetical protein